MAGKINVPVAVAVQGIANAQKQFQQLGKSVGGAGKAAGVAAISFAGFLAGVKAADFTISAIAGARDLERNLAGLKTVFDEVTPQMTQFSKGAVDLGLSMSEAAKASTFIGSVLKQSGFSIQETADLTEELTRLATDLSITYGYDVQEALLGMTALFRGEYDPIEKFGVAMKQSEINSELMAQGLNHLEGAERRFAEQQIRVNLLMERSADAQGAMVRQSGTLAVEQLKLAATFGNLRDSVAESLLPVMTDLSVVLRESLVDIEPVLKEAFDELAPVLRDVGQTLIPVFGDGLRFVIELVKEIVQLVGDMFNPTTELGESLAALGLQIESIFYSITGNKLELETVFNIIAEVIRFITDLTHDVLYVIENTIIGLKVLGDMASAFFTGDWARLFSTDWAGMIEGQIASKDAFNAQMLAAKQLNYELSQMETNALKVKVAVDSAAGWSLSMLPKYLQDSIRGISAPSLTGGGGGAGDSTGKKEAKDFVGDFFKGISEEVKKQQARIRLQNLGLSESLVEQILGSQGWEGIFKKVIASGVDGLKELQEEFNRTAAGIKELEAIRAAALDEATKYIEKMQEEADRLQEIFLEAQQAAEDFKREMQEISRVSILPTIAEELGQFEAAVVGSFEAIQNKLSEGLIDGRILEQDFRELSAYAKVEEDALRAISAQRDDLANRKSLSEALIAEYRGALTSALQITNLLDKIESKASERTVKEVKEGTMIVGKSLRELSFTLTREYTEVIEAVSDRSQGLVDNFRNMADKARTFGENLRRLRDLGLDPQLFSQLVQAGVEAGGETAQALVDGGAGTINEINSLFQEIDALGAELGEEVAASLYGAGVDMGDGLLAGIASRQAELETLAREMANAFNTNFNASVSVAVNKPVQQAQAAAEAAQAAVPDVAQINLDALAEVNRLLKGASDALNVVKGETVRAGIQLKSGVLEALKQDILSGAVVDIGGIESGLSSQELIARASQLSPTVNNTYNVTVNADSRVGGVKAGESFVAAINTFEDANGNSNIYLR
jgi:hypothetical protein